MANCKKFLEDITADIETAAADTDSNPTEKEKKSGDYDKGEVTIHGMKISIETPKGATRSGTNKDGKEWSVKMPAHYGYFNGVVGKDKDEIDCYISSTPDSPAVFIINQVNESGNFDEHKVMLGFKTRDEAIATYDKAFNDNLGPKLRKSVVETTITGLKNWLKTGNKKIEFSLSESLIQQILCRKFARNTNIQD